MRRRSPLLIAVPRNGTEWAIAIFVCVLAGFSEELAYRGVLVHVLEPRTGHLGAALLSAVAFAAAHAVQGVRTMVTILVIALVLQLLVDATHTLVVAMVVHASYDVVAKVLFARFARREGLLEAA
ncbi:MAG: CPBP family intramembrane glutamic endopeptidase [Planctomycetota bacterium]